MSQSVLTIRVDDNLKRRFDAFCADAGMNSSVAVTMFIKATLREKKVPFEITGDDDPYFTGKNWERIQRSMERLEAGLGVEHELIEVDDEEDMV